MRWDRPRELTFPTSCMRIKSENLSNRAAVAQEWDGYVWSQTFQLVLKIFVRGASPPRLMCVLCWTSKIESVFSSEDIIPQSSGGGPALLPIWLSNAGTDWIRLGQRFVSFQL